MSQPLYSHILLDRSSSMEVIRDKTIEAVNEYAKALAADALVDTAVSLSLFDAISDRSLALDCVVDGKPVKDWVPLTRDSYEPRGSTPLNDAILATIERMEKEWHRPGERITLTIMTDGHENSSTHTTREVKSAVERVQGKGWMVVFLGANIDSFEVGSQQMGVNAANTMDWATENVGAVMQSVARSHGSYGLTGQSVSGSFTNEERARAMSPDPQDQQDLLKKYSQANANKKTA